MRRVTFGQTSESVQRYIQENYGRMDKLQRQLASGRKLMRPSDDPIGVSTALDMRGSLSQLGQYHRNADGGAAYLATVDTTIGANNEFLQHARELAIQGANDTLNAENRVYISREVRAVFDQMVAVANSNFRGEYLFSGANTQVAPYEVRDGSASITAAILTAATVGAPIQLVDGNVTDSSDTPAGAANAYHIVPGTFAINGLTEGTDFSVDYVNGTVTFTPPGTAALALVGTGPIAAGFSWVRRNEADLDGIINRELDQDQLSRINTTASDVYGSDRQDNNFAAMIRLLDGLVHNQGEIVRQSISSLDSALGRNLSAQAANGARANQFNAAMNRADSKTVDLTDYQSKLEDVDFAEAITQLSMQQAVYDASLKMGARALQQTLMDFL